MSEPSRSSFEFGPFLLDTKKRLLFRDGQLVPLPPKVLETLLALIEHRGGLISKEQLLSFVWGDAAVEEGGLARNISLLRKILGEKPDDHHYIVTVPARGYQFVAEVRERSGDESSAPAPFVPPLRPHPASTGLWRGIGTVLLLLGFGAGVVIWRSPSRLFRAGTVANPRLIRLTSTSGLNLDPALSPDGSLVAYVSDRARTGNLDIWVQPVRGETPTRITSAEGDEVEPAFSPDGSSIVFSGGEAGGIYVVGTLGGESRQIVRGTRTRTPRFSPDGQSILYWIGMTAFVSPPGLPGVIGTLAVVPAAGGAPRALASEFASARYGIWSPDGRKILFLGERFADGGASLDWYVIGSDGEGAVRTGAVDALRTMHVSRAPIPGAWTPEGVVFTTTDEAMSNVWQLPISPATGRVTGAAARLTFGSALERSASVSAGGAIVFTTLTVNVDVWRVPLDARTGAASGPPERITDDAARDVLMNVSADGRMLAFLSSRSGRDEAWLENLETREERQLTFSSALGGRLSPDGRRVAIERLAGERHRIELFDALSRQSSLLCDDCQLHGGGWSSDGVRLLVARRLGALEGVVAIDVNSKREIEVARHSVWNVFQSRFSPDDGWVAFHTTNAPDRRQVYAARVPIDGPAPVDTWMPIAADFGIYANWSADGTGVYHFSLRDGYMCAWLQPVDPQSKRPVGAPRAVQHFHQPRLRAAARANPTNDVMNGVLYVTLTETTGNIWMLDAAKTPR